MPSATEPPAAASAAPTPTRPRRRLAPRGRAGLAALLGAVALASAGPATAATHSGGPAPDPSPPTSGSPAPSPDPVPQATGVGGVVSQSPVSASQPTGSHSSGTSSPTIQIRVPNYTVPAVPRTSAPAETARPRSTGAIVPRRTALPSAPAGTAHHRIAPARPHRHRTTVQTRSEREAAAAFQQLRNRLAAEAGSSAAADPRLVAAPAHGDGTLLLIGAGVLLFLAAMSGALLRKL